MRRWAVAEHENEFALLQRQAGAAMRALLRPRSYLGVVREALLGGVHLAAYPLGLLPAAGLTSARRVPTPAPAELPEPTRPPVILIHGYFHNHSAFLVMSRALRCAGFDHLHTVDYNPVLADLNELAERLAQEVQRMLARTGARRCVLIGHSMGGLVARHYVQLLGGDEHVDTVVTLGAPHRGTYSSYLGIGPAAAQLRPGSAYLRMLDDSARPSSVRWVAFYSDLDFMVTPAVSAKLVHPALAATNVRVRDTGHLSMLLSREVLAAVVAQLGAVAA